MNKIAPLVIVLAALASMGAAPAPQAPQCKCSSQPFTPDPPCVKHCVTGLLVIASSDDLAQVFGFDAKTTKIIMSAKGQLRSADQNIGDHLDEKTNEIVKSSFAMISNERLRQFIYHKIEHEGNENPLANEFLRSLKTNRVLELLALDQEVLTHRRTRMLVGGKVIYQTVISDYKIGFASTAPDLPAEVQRSLDEFAKEVEQLKKKDKDIYIEIQGHTDNVGSEQYNEHLGLQKAESARRYLVQKHGLPADRIYVFSYGSSHGIADNKTREGRAKNRRLELIVRDGPS